MRHAFLRTFVVDRELGCCRGDARDGSEGQQGDGRGWKWVSVLGREREGAIADLFVEEPRRKEGKGNQVH